MKVAILGGGITGLTSAYYLAKKGWQITIFEKEKFLGGMASGFKQRTWDWFLEKTVHHLFANDFDFLNFSKEIGFDRIFFKKPETASLYLNSKQKTLTTKPISTSSIFKIYPLDTPFDFLRLPFLSFSEKLRAGLVLAFFKLSPFFKIYEQQTAQEFLEKYMGKRSWEILFKNLFRKKFGKYAGNILASFIWARIKKRTKKLGYIEGGFQNFIDFLSRKLRNFGVNLITDCKIEKIKITNRQKYQILNEKFDIVVSTLPTPILIKIGEKLFPNNYLSQLKKIRYLNAVSLVLETVFPILKKTYWLNLTEESIPIMGIFQQTNFIDKKYYDQKHICYLGWYVDEKESIWQMTKKEIIEFVKPYLKKIFDFKSDVLNSYLFKIPFAQPIFDKEFLKNKPDFETPLKNFYIANLDMTYPYDRGTNYAVLLGKKVVRIILSGKLR